MVADVDVVAAAVVLVSVEVALEAVRVGLLRVVDIHAAERGAVVGGSAATAVLAQIADARVAVRSELVGAGGRGGRLLDALSVLGIVLSVDGVTARARALRDQMRRVVVASLLQLAQVVLDEKCVEFVAKCWTLF